MFFRVIYYLSTVAFLFTGAVATVNDQTMAVFIPFAINFGVLTLYKFCRLRYKWYKRKQAAILRIFPNTKDSLSKEEFLKNTGFDFSKVNKYLGDHDKYSHEDYLYIMETLDKDELKEYYAKFSVEERAKHTEDW